MSNNKRQITSVPFKSYLGILLATGKNSTVVAPINPLSSRLAGIADEYQLYRMTKFRFRIHPVASTAVAGESIITAYIPNVIDATPAWVDLNENVNSAMIMAGTTTDASGTPSNSAPQLCPTNWVNVPRSVLRGSLEWYKAVPGTFATWDENQGVLCTASSVTSSTVGVFIEIDGICEFTGPADPGATPALRAAQRLAERQRLLELLAMDPKQNVLTAEALGKSPGPSQGRDKARP